MTADRRVALKSDSVLQMEDWAGARQVFHELPDIFGKGVVRRFFRGRPIPELVYESDVTDIMASHRLFRPRGRAHFSDSSVHVRSRLSDQRVGEPHVAVALAIFTEKVNRQTSSLYFDAQVGLIPDAIVSGQEEWGRPISDDDTRITRAIGNTAWGPNESYILWNNGDFPTKVDELRMIVGDEAVTDMLGVPEWAYENALTFLREAIDIPDHVGAAYVALESLRNLSTFA